MENKSVRKIDVFNIIQYVLKKWFVVAIIAVLFAGAIGGKEYFNYKVQKLNELYANANKMNLNYGSFMLYITRYDDSDNYYNRIEDVTAIVRSYKGMEYLKSKYAPEVDYPVIANSIAAVPVGINLLEVSLEGNVMGIPQDKIVDVTKDYCNFVTKIMYENLGEGCVTVVDEARAGAYEYNKALKGEEGDIKLITKKGVIKKGILGGIIGGIVGVLCVVFYVLLSTLLRTRDELVECFGLSLLGSVDKTGADKEEYKRVINKLADKKTIGLVSITDKENRNVMSENLVKLMAVNDKTAVYVKIDRDTNNAQDNVLYQYVTGKKNIKDILADSDHKGLKVMNCSLASDEATDLATHVKFAALVEELKGAFDYVVIDCPAAKTSAACLSIAKECDAFVAVAGANAVKEADVYKFMHNLKENEIECLGLIYVG